MSDSTQEERDFTKRLLEALFSATEQQKHNALDALESASVKEESHETELFVPLAEIGEKLSVHEASLRRWHVPGHSMGRCRRYRMSEVLEYLESSAFRRRQRQLKVQRRIAQREKDLQ
jgi:hypothetical protein